jgi:hypothetical protein
MATPKDKDGDIMMMTVKRRSGVPGGVVDRGNDVFKVHEDEVIEDQENICPNTKDDVARLSRATIVATLSCIKGKAAIVSKLADRITELASSA